MPDALRGPLPALATLPRMTRCECAGLSFEDVRRRMLASGLSLEETLERSGCGRTCTACVPDLVDYLRGAGTSFSPTR